MDEPGSSKRGSRHGSDEARPTWPPPSLGTDSATIKQQVLAEVQRRGLASVMNDTKWRELQSAVRGELPFPPPFQLKWIIMPRPEPEEFEADVSYWGDWSDESLYPFYAIEWLRIRPRCLVHRGMLIAPEVRSVEPVLLAILQRYHIPHRCDGECIWIYGYTD